MMADVRYNGAVTGRASRRQGRDRGMSTRTIEIEYPDDVLASTDEEHVRRLAREAFYARLYAEGLMSSGRAAQLLGITRWDFLDLLGRYGVSYFDEAIDQDQGAGRAQP